MTPEEAAKFLRELAKESRRGLASDDYYLGGTIDAPDPETLEQVAALVISLSSPSAPESGTQGEAK